ncbi:MAG TPA: hypothetical protein VGE10_04545 [Zeimonas sp.]
MAIGSPGRRCVSDERFDVPFYHRIVVVATDFDVDRACLRIDRIDPNRAVDPAGRCNRPRPTDSSIRFVDNQLGVAAHSVATSPRKNDRMMVSDLLQQAVEGRVCHPDRRMERS